MNIELLTTMKNQIDIYKQMNAIHGLNEGTAEVISANLERIAELEKLACVPKANKPVKR